MSRWIVDVSHTNVGFSVKHMMIATVHGNFGEMEGSLQGDPMNLEDGEIEFKIDVRSINTNNKGRDEHLRSDDFFDVENHPYITFNSTEIKSTEEDVYDVVGDLTIRGTTKPTTFKVTRLGKATNPWGVPVVAFEANTEISRAEFGLTWNQTLETGGVLVGDNIKINVELQLNPEQEE